MKLTQKQWEWLVKAPKRIEVDGTYYDFYQSWDKNGEPIVEMIKFGEQYLKEIFSPNKELTQFFKDELHKVWEVWKEMNKKILHINTDDILEPFKNWEIDEIKVFHVNVDIKDIQKADKVIFHHKGKSIVWKDRNSTD